MANELSIRREDLLLALKPLRLARSPKNASEALISMEGDSLCFSVIGIATYVQAEGSWTGEVRISGAFLLALAKMPPPGDPMIVSVRDGRFHFGPMSTACVEQESWRSEISLPLDPSIVEILRLAFHYPPERVERAGLKKRVEEAQTRAAKLLDLAAATLAPLGITREDLRDLLHGKMRS